MNTHTFKDWWTNRHPSRTLGRQPLSHHIIKRTLVFFIDACAVHGTRPMYWFCIQIKMAIYCVVHTNPVVGPLMIFWGCPPQWDGHTFIYTSAEFLLKWPDRANTVCINNKWMDGWAHLTILQIIALRSQLVIRHLSLRDDLWMETPGHVGGHWLELQTQPRESAKRHCNVVEIVPSFTFFTDTHQKKDFHSNGDLYHVPLLY